MARSDGSWDIDDLPGVVVAAPDRRAAMTRIRAAIAAVLEVPGGRLRRADVTPGRPGWAGRNISSG